jgi:hypothetical protein
VSWLVAWCLPIDHCQRGFAFGRAGCSRCIRLHHQAVAVLDQRVAHEAELGLAANDPRGMYALD